MISWAHLIKNYRRVFAAHLVALHVMIITAVNDDSFEWRFVSTAAVSYAAFSAFTGIIGLCTNGMREARDRGALWAWTVELSTIAGHSAIIVLFVLELGVCGLSRERLGLTPLAPAVNANGTLVYPACFSWGVSSETLQSWLYAHNATNYPGLEAHLSPNAVQSRLSAALGVRTASELVALAYLVGILGPFLFPNVFAGITPRAGRGRAAYMRGSGGAMERVGTRVVYISLWMVRTSAHRALCVRVVLVRISRNFVCHKCGHAQMACVARTRLPHLRMRMLMAAVVAGDFGPQVCVRVLARYKAGCRPNSLPVGRRGESLLLLGLRRAQLR